MERITLQKLLFLISRQQTKPTYDFIPYKFGCYSHSAYADLTTMVKQGLLTDFGNSYKANASTNYFNTLKDSDKQTVLRIAKQYGKMSQQALMKQTYRNYPYWAIKSEIAPTILSKQELKQIEESRPKRSETTLFTIGYEGISLEEYLNRLIKNDVKVLVDVRNNPLSMKYGFSKSQLERYCNSLEIGYAHFPEVGIRSEKRNALNTQADYDKLFSAYRKETLTKTTSSQLKILNLLKEKKRIALTCFEANISQCHRKPLAEAIESLPEFSYSVKHI